MPLLKYNDIERKRCLRLYAAGMTCPQVEGVTGVDRQTVQKWANEEGVIRGRDVQLSRRDKEEIKTLYRQYRHTCPEIARITGIPKYQVYYYLRREGLNRSKSQARRLREAKRAKRSGRKA